MLSSAQHVDITPQPIDRQINAPSKRKIAYIALSLVVLQEAILVAVAVTTGLIRHQHLTWSAIFFGKLTQWDSRWFLQIAEHGYTNIAHTAFFPVYPMLIHIVHLGTGVPFRISALAVSLVAFLIALAVFGRWLQEQFGYRTAVVGMALITLFPTAFFFRAAYTESTFLAFAMLAVYASSHRRFITAGVFVALATLTRNTGAFLDIVLLLDYLAYRQMGFQFWRRNWWQRLTPACLGLVLPAAALAGYLCWLKLHTGYFLSFALAEKIWHRAYADPIQTVIHSFTQLFHLQSNPLWLYHLCECLAWLFVCIAIVRGLRYVRGSAHQTGNLLYAALVLIACSMAPARTGPHLQHFDYLLSMPRFDLMVFPAFAYLAHQLHAKVMASTIVLCCSTAGLCLLYGIFCAGHFIA